MFTVIKLPSQAIVVLILQNRPIRRLYSYSKIDISEGCIHTPKSTYQKPVFILLNRPIRKLYSCSKIVIRRLYWYSNIVLSEGCIHTLKSFYQKAVFILQNRSIRKLYSYSKIGISESCIHTPKHTLYTINEPFIAGYISSMFPMQCYKLWVHFIVG